MSKKLVAVLFVACAVQLGSGYALANKADPFGVKGMSPNSNPDAADLSEPDYSGVTSAPMDQVAVDEVGKVAAQDGASFAHEPAAMSRTADGRPVQRQVQAAPVVAPRAAPVAHERALVASVASGAPVAAKRAPVAATAPVVAPVRQQVAAAAPDPADIAPVVVPPPVVAPPPVETPEGKRVSLSRDERAFVDQEAHLMQRIRVLRLQRDEYMLREEIRKIAEGDREPEEQVVVPVISMPVLDVVDVPPEPPARLVSTWGTEGALKADLMFEGRRRSYTPGDKVGGWTVKSVRTGEVVIEKGRETMTLRRGG